MLCVRGKPPPLALPPNPVNASTSVLRMVNTQSSFALTDLEFALRTARALVSTLPDKATSFVADALARTVDPRLRHLIEPALAALGRNDVTAARKWLDRACEYEAARRERIQSRGRRIDP